ncbi:phosphatidate cytidylyltransferase [Thermosipho melanesiensis]|uniref:Phosphatidate cytidylyltransferase n=2 Tax=Thermosipho melanesiensis TaxID=46541 RepID=A6LMH8_THEM4|nr:phosphatidate cytidylyltransferase [Thermosipho melanesiensis]ABR31129.1 phosphatidate cytidylyltransferase [Thermosipho melanesiensis BI429]APT74220.1 phosphatidate cytidylyltransferase [Thermosipho melanesiensis]OOC36163.1 phosphatidate cytidylyltransferase [Thermosipho melanesiensis]OOC36981.1 phosphatidate cytidylyltransferase [Thermosipho melanesiensis]OOC37733.1 phosphatidate cytidylyltransferase [Thermosipho melanesiensis]
MKQETKIRLFSALVVAPFVVACFISYQSLIGLVSAIVFLSSSELYFSTLIKYKKMGIVVIYIGIVSAFPILFGLWFLNFSMELFSVFYIIGISLTLMLVKSKDVIMEYFGIFSISMIYISFNLSFFIPIYKYFGVALALLTLTLSWAYDSFAYFFGLSFGKHKLSKVYSPNKSYEGLFGGIFGTFIYVLVYFYIINNFFDYNISYWYAVPFSIITGIFDTLGDLFESAIKRAYGVKHIGKFLPGHGGMLDRIDGLLFVAPVIYIFLRFFS